MPESRYDPADALVPETPAGYRDPVPFRYSLLVLLALGAGLVYVAAAGFGWLLLEIHGLDRLEPIVTVEDTESAFAVTVGGTQFWLAFVAAVLVLVVVHEGVHGLVYRLRGYDVSYGVAPQIGAVYAAAFHQFQTREDNLVVGIAPLLVLDALLLAVLFVPVPVVAFAAFLGLVFNTAGAAGDLYLVARLLALPRGTLLYDSDIRHMYVFYPETDDRSPDERRTDGGVAAVSRR